MVARVVGMVVMWCLMVARWWLWWPGGGCGGQVVLVMVAR